MMLTGTKLTRLAALATAVFCTGAAGAWQALALAAPDAKAPTTASQTPSAPESPDAFGPLWQPPLPAGAVRRVGWKSFAHPNLPIWALACSPDGKRIASYDPRGTCRGERSGLVRVWDARTGRPLRSILLRPTAPGRGGSRVRGIALSRDFRLAAAAVDEQTVGLWSLDTGDEQARFRAEPKPLCAVALSDDGALVAAGFFSDPRVLVWETATRKRKAELELHAKGCRGLALSPDGRYLAALDGDRRVTLWDVGTGKLIREVARAPELTSGAAPLAFDPEGRKLAVLMGFRKPVECFDVPGGKRLFAVQCSQFPYFENGPVFSPDGKHLAAAGWTGVWDAATGREVWRAPMGNRDADRAVGFLKTDGGATVLVAGGDSRFLRFWDYGKATEIHPQLGHRGSLNTCGVALSPDGRLIGTCSSGDCRVRVRDAETGKPVHELYPEDMPGTVAWSPDGSRLYSTGSTSGGGRGGSYLHIWDPAAGREQVRIQVNGGRPLSSPDGKMLVLSGGQDIQVVDPASGQPLFALPGQGPGHDRAVGFTPDSRRLISLASGFDLKSGSMSIWDLPSQKPVWTTDCRPSSAVPPALSADAALLASLSIEEVVMEVVQMGRHQHKFPRPKTALTLVEMASGEVAAKLPALDRGAMPRSLAFSGTGRLLAIGDSHGDVTVWDLLAGGPVHVFRGHESPAIHVQWRQSDRRLVSAELGGTILFWDTAPCLAKQKHPKLTRDDLARLWAHLADQDAAKAFQATLAFCCAGGDAVAYLREHARDAPPKGPDVGALIAQLDSDRYAERQEASKKLAELGPAAAAGMRAALEKTPSAEVRQRLRALLARLDRPTSQWTGLLRRRRAEVILGRIATPEALKLLHQLQADAQPGAPPPQERPPTGPSPHGLR